MTQEETVKIMAMLSAYYGQGKSDAKIMAKAWHLILKDFDYAKAEKAVIDFARNDTRDYAAFPAPGQIVATIRDTEKLIEAKYKVAWVEIYNTTEYAKLSDSTKAICGKEMFDKIRQIPEEERHNYRELFFKRVAPGLIEGRANEVKPIK